MSIIRWSVKWLRIGANITEIFGKSLSSRFPSQRASNIKQCVCWHSCIGTDKLQNMKLFKQERLKRRNIRACLDQYAAQNSKYARPPIPSQPSTQKVFYQWHTQYDPTMKHSHCETVYAKELFQWLFFELVHSLRILSIHPTFKLAGLTKECQWCT